MKHNFNSNDVRRHFHGKNHPPLRTLVELAEEFCIPWRQLSGYLIADPDAPKPVLNNRSARKRATWFNPQEMRKWWAKRGNKDVSA